MDDWGSASALLISPAMWVAYFKPLYKDYVDLAHAHGKFVLMHSDGYILAIYEHLIEIGVDAINSQLFRMPIEEIGDAFQGAHHLLGRDGSAAYPAVWHAGGCARRRRTRASRAAAIRAAGSSARPSSTRAIRWRTSGPFSRPGGGRLSGSDDRCTAGISLAMARWFCGRNLLRITLARAIVVLR